MRNDGDIVDTVPLQPIYDQRTLTASTETLVKHQPANAISEPAKAKQIKKHAQSNERTGMMRCNFKPRLTIVMLAFKCPFGSKSLIIKPTHTCHQNKRSVKFVIDNNRPKQCSLAAILINSKDGKFPQCRRLDPNWSKRDDLFLEMRLCIMREKNCHRQAKSLASSKTHCGMIPDRADDLALLWTVSLETNTKRASRN